MTKDIQKGLSKHLVLIGHEAVCENFGHVFFEMDVASLSKSGMLHEFEVKISRSDFAADKKKGTGVKKFQSYENISFGHEWKCPNYFYYVCPDGLIKESEIPFYAGLYYFKDNEIFIVKKAKRIHNVPADREKILTKMLRMTCQRLYLGCTMLTHLNREAKRKHEEWESYRNQQTQNLIDFANNLKNKKDTA